MAKPVDLSAYRDLLAKTTNAPGVPTADTGPPADSPAKIDPDPDAEAVEAAGIPRPSEPAGRSLANAGVAATRYSLPLEDAPTHVHGSTGPDGNAPLPDPDLVAILLDAGAFDEAERAITALIEADPGEAAPWFLQARLFAGRGQAVEAQEACRRAIELWPDILPVYRLLSDLAGRDGGDVEGWLGIAQRTLLAQQPDDALLANRIGSRLCAAGCFAEALPYLRQSAPVLGHQDSALWNYSTSLALTGGYHELLSIEPLLITLARDVPPPFGPFAHLAAAKLALQFDRAAVRRAIAAVQASSRWMDATQLAERLAEAIAQRQPFSVILLSEAHARLVAYASLRVHLMLDEAEMSAVVNSVWMDAFGDPIETHGAASGGALGWRLLAAIAEADVVAMPDETHLAGAHEHFGFLAEMQRIVLQREDGLCAGLAVIGEMHDAIPFLRPLLADQLFLGFVGSHPDLAERLGRFGQIGETVTYLVPAALNGSGIALPLRGRDHFPDKFEQTLAALTVPFRGAIFLVAAGLLGSLYCARIKQLGGIAVDIDSIVTRWIVP